MTNLIVPDGRSRPVAVRLATYAGALLLVAITTIAGLLVASRWGNSPVVMLYLLPVLAGAIYGGLGPGLVAAVISTLAYNYYFTAPFHTFEIHSAADIVTVVILFLVAVVCSQLTASVRRQARLASEYASRNAAIAGFARRLLSCGNEAEVAEVGAAQLARLFDCHVTVFHGHAEAQLLASTLPDSTQSPSDLAAASFTMSSGERSGRFEKRGSEADWQFHPVVTGSAVIAAIGIARGDGGRPILDDRAQLFESLLDQLALALERARLDDEARETAALRARDKLRSALLSSIGDDVKPALKSIQTSVRTLRREGSFDRALIGELDKQLAGIERHIDNLVDIRPGEQPEPLVIGDFAIDLHHRKVTRDLVEVHLTPKEFAVLTQLAKHAGRVLTHAQILRAVWGPAQQDNVDYLRVAIRALRQKLERDPARPQLIVNEPGVGYRLVV